MTAPLDGKTAVVTGGGRGIGAAAARALAKAGAAVVVGARTASEIEAVASALRDEGRTAWALPCDVQDPDNIREFANRATEQLEHVDILVNSAGVATSGPVHKLTLEDWNRVLAVNATGTLLSTQEFLPGMVEQKWGRVINVASIAGLEGARYIAAYGASKHAVIGLTRCLAAEVAADGITVNAVCPGYVNTQMTQQSVERIVSHTRMSKEQVIDAIFEMSPQRRLIEPEEVAHAVLSLCDDNAKGINGQAIVIDGGGLLA